MDAERRGGSGRGDSGECNKITLCGIFKELIKNKQKGIEMVISSSIFIMLYLRNNYIKNIMVSSFSL